MKPAWMKELLRDAEGEGGGSGGGGANPSPTASGGEPPSSDTRLSAMEQRLERITSAVETMTSNTKRNQQAGAIAARERELNTALNNAKDGVKNAEAASASAFEDGDGVQIAKAQRELSEAIAKSTRAEMDVETFKGQVEAAKKRAEEAPSGGQLDDTNLNKWKAKHEEWYGIDAAMTKAAAEIDRQITDAGVISIGSKAYFDAVDNQMKQRFPEKFGGAPPTAGAGGGNPPANNPGGGKVAASVVEGWRRMGIDVNDPKVIDRMINTNREIAVSKGILPATPVSGPVITR